MNFGVPNQRRKKKEELFPTRPVLTINAMKGTGTARSMTLNTKATELLNLPEEGAVATFSFDVNDQTQECENSYIVNANHDNIPDFAKIRVTKGAPRKMSEKRTYEYISEKAFKLDNNVDNHFEIEFSHELEGIKYFKITPLVETKQQEEEVVFESLTNDVEEPSTAFEALAMENKEEELNQVNY